MDNGRHLFEVKNLSVEFRMGGGTAAAVRGINYTLDRGEVLAILGESGSGKTVHARAALGILDSPPAFASGEVRLDGVNLLGLSEADMGEFRGERISMLFQDPHAALDPVFSIGDQLGELLRVRRKLSRGEARDEAIRLLQQAGIADARDRMRSYPHELSGGIAQRAMIALAIALDPDVLLADEPTSSLDVTVQAQVLELLKKLMDERTMGLVLITHNIAVAAGFADRIAVMYAGRIVEMGLAPDVYTQPLHPYTGALLRSIPRLDQRRDRLPAIPGKPPGLGEVPPGCPFHPRCPFAVERCRVEVPQLIEWMPGRLAACHRVGEIEP